MRIALLVSGMLQKKTESLTITTQEFAKKLTKKNHKVFIITQKKFPSPSIEIKDKITYYRINKWGKFSLYNKLISFPFAIRKMQKEGKFNIIHGFSASPILVLRGILAKNFFSNKTKIVHTLKSYPIKKDVKAGGKNKLISRIGDWGYKLLNLADIITVPTNVHAKKLIRKGVNKNKIKVIHSFINLDKFFPKDKKKLKEQYGYQDNKVIFNYGSMWEIKGTDQLIKSMPDLIKQFPNVRLLLAPRNRKQALNKYLKVIQEMELTKYVQFILEDVNIEDYVNLADVIVLPYPHLEGTEGNPSCLLEALACKTPVVTTNLPELNELFSECTKVVEPNNIEELTKMVSFVLKNDNQRIIEEGLKIAQKFNIDQNVDSFISVYNE